MARTTVDDCIQRCENHFELAFGAAGRAREILSGMESKVPVDGDKPVVVALREIAKGETVLNPAPEEEAAAVIAAAAAPPEAESPDEPEPPEADGVLIEKPDE